MKIIYHKIFEKQFKKLIDKDKYKIFKAIEIFVENPHNINLNNHKLHGSLDGKRVISAAPDLRLVFEEFDDYTLVIFLDLGKHNRVY